MNATATKPTRELFDPFDNRNLTEEFKGRTTDEIREMLSKRRTGMINIATNLTMDINKSSCVRNNNAFLGAEFIFLNKPNDQIVDAPEGTKRWDKRGSVGTQNYEPIRHVRYDNWRELFAELRERGYTIYAVDNTPGYNPVSVYKEKFPYKSVFLYGEEGAGLSDELIAAADRMVYIPQGGSVRSINISVANGIISAFYSAQHGIQE